MNSSKPILKTVAKRALSSTALLSLLWLAMSSTAMAQSFTFNSTSDEIKSLGGDGQNGVPHGASSWSGNSVGVFADGSKNKTTFSCVMMSQPPNNTLFQNHMICDVKATDGAYSAVMGCNIIDMKTFETSCIGGLYGTGGTYSGRRGSITNYVKAMGADSKGTGQWFE